MSLVIAAALPAASQHPADLTAARRRIFRLAAPLLRANGYRGTTLKSLSRSIRLAPSSLYHYFTSKRALALFPLTDENDICARLHASFAVAPKDDPLAPVRVLVDYWTGELPDLLLAVDLAREVGAEDWALAQMKQMYGYGLEIISLVIRSAAPTFGDENAREVGRVLMSMLAGSPITDMNASPVALRRHAVGVLRQYLIPAGVNPVDFDAAVASP
jgi:AcrR family transcriptional regulator